MRRNKVLTIILFLILGFTLVACGDKTTKMTQLPNLIGKSKTEITQIFEEAKVDFEFANYFIKGSTTIEFVSYANDLEIGGDLPEGKIVINMSVDFLILPDLSGLNREEIISKFESLGVKATDLNLRPGINKEVPIGTFIGYGDDIKVGNEFTFQYKLTVFYDMSSALPDLDGLNKYEISRELRDLNLTSITYKYVLDNNKEYDSFAGYTNAKPGDSVSGSDSIEVQLYENDDVNNEKTINVEKQLFISKYIDGVGNNQAIEIYNPTDKDINLSDFYLAILSNGNFTPTETIDFTGTLKSKTTFLIISNKADSVDLTEKANLKVDNLIFDGNDTIQLRRKSNNTYIDTIYQVGNITSTLDDEVFVRRENITAGNRFFTQNEWMGFIPTYTTIVGTHPYAGAKDPVFLEIEDKTFQQYGMTQVKYTHAADGDTVYFDSLDPRDTTSYQGNNRIRFIMVDTPETDKPGVVGEPYAQVAKNFTVSVMEKASKIIIQSDKSSGLTETYGRHLGYIWYHLDTEHSFTGINADGSATVLSSGWHLLNYELVKYGLGERILAKTYNYADSITPGNRYSYQWAMEAEHYARTNKQGLYSGVDRD